MSKSKKMLAFFIAIILVVGSFTTLIGCKSNEITVDKTALQAQITIAESKKQADYTTESWTILASALSAAKTLNTKDHAKQAEVDTATETLKSAIEALVLKTVTVDKTALQAQITIAESKIESDYTVQSWGALVTALSAAKTVDANINATQSEVDNAKTALSVAITALELKPAVNKTVLVAQISIAENKIEADYTIESWTVLSNALSNAKIINAKADATQIEVDNAVTALSNAIKALVRKAVVVDKTALILEIELAESKIESEYTEDSFLKLTNALASAKTINTKADATQAEVNSAKTALALAISTLAKKPDVDKSVLITRIKLAESKEESLYTTDSFAVLATELASAITINTKEDATQEEVNTAIEDLKLAILGLVLLQEPTEVDKIELASLIKECEDLKEQDYTSDSWANFSDYLAQAVIVNDADATQAQVNEAFDLLTIAKSELIAKEVIVKADKSELVSQIEIAQLKAETSYTQESWQVFADALDMAIQINNKEDAIQAEVDIVAVALKQAIAQLKKVDTALDDMIAQAENLIESDYTRVTWAVLVDKLDEAKIVNNNSSSPQSQLDKVALSLEIALASLVEYEEPIFTQNYQLTFVSDEFKYRQDRYDLAQTLITEMVTTSMGSAYLTPAFNFEPDEETGMLPVGVHSIAYRTKDNNGDYKTESFNVTVLDADVANYYITAKTAAVDSFSKNGITYSFSSVMGGPVYRVAYNSYFELSSEELPKELWYYGKDATVLHDFEDAFIIKNIAQTALKFKHKKDAGAMIVVFDKNGKAVFAYNGPNKQVMNATNIKRSPNGVTENDKTSFTIPAGGFVLFVGNSAKGNWYSEHDNGQSTGSTNGDNWANYSGEVNAYDIDGRKFVDVTFASYYGNVVKIEKGTGDNSDLLVDLINQDPYFIDGWAESTILTNSTTLTKEELLQGVKIQDDYADFSKDKLFTASEITVSIAKNVADTELFYTEDLTVESGTKYKVRFAIKDEISGQDFYLYKLVNVKVIPTTNYTKYTIAGNDIYFQPAISRYNDVSILTKDATQEEVWIVDKKFTGDISTVKTWNYASLIVIDEKGKLITAYEPIAQTFTTNRNAEFIQKLSVGVNAKEIVLTEMELMKASNETQYMVIFPNNSNGGSHTINPPASIRGLGYMFVNTYAKKSGSEQLFNSAVFTIKEVAGISTVTA